MQPFEFPVRVYGDVTKYNEVLSKARCRIFYKYANRNGTYITDEFADRLLSTVHYVPIKGIYKENDFTDHGKANDEGRIYGIVPENYNLAWEPHMDEDGVERIYACVDVLLFTALYNEANSIVGKSLSMEIYAPSIKTHRAFVEGTEYIVFDEGVFLGLQALGDTVEPCFEGASFYSLQKTIQDTITKIKSFSKGGKSEMPNFELSDTQKGNKVWALLNPKFNEKDGWVCNHIITSMNDEYALALNLTTLGYERVYFKTNKQKDTVEITKRVAVYNIDVTEDEQAVAENLKVLNGGNYNAVNPNLTAAEENATQCATLTQKVADQEGTINTLNDKVKDYEALSEEVTSLREFKATVENQQKQAVIAQYTNKLSDEIIKKYTDALDKYSVKDLDKELAYEFKECNMSLFTSNEDVLVPKDVTPSGIESILKNYSK